MGGGDDGRRDGPFSLSWHLEDYLDVQWAKVPRYALAALKGFTGLAKGEAIERTFDERYGSLQVGELAIPLTSIVYDMDRGVVDYFGSESTPELTIGRLVRIAIALPVFIEAVEVDGHLYVDGGIIDLLPAEPILRDGGFDHVFAVNFMLRPSSSRRTSAAGRTPAWACSRPAARRSRASSSSSRSGRCGSSATGLTMIDAADHTLLRGPAFYDLFIDRSRWPALIREGYERATAALDALRAPATAPARGGRGRG